MEELLASLVASGFMGEVDASTRTKLAYSHDASLFEVVPQAVVFPKDATDVSILTSWAAKQKRKHPQLSLTARSGGTDMSGGAINTGIIVDFNRHMTHIGTVTPRRAQTQPGAFYRDFEKATLKHKALMPSFPASRELCTVGGMVANNAGGEKSLEYGKTINFVTKLDVILDDGSKATFQPLNSTQLAAKMKLKNREGEIYRRMHALIDKNYDRITKAEPRVSKNSTGYNLWDVWDKQKDVFDLTKLIVGSQGTLAMVTDIHFKLVPTKKYSGVLVVFMKDTRRLGDVIVDVMKRKPATFESFDNYTLMLSIKFFFYFRKTLGYRKLIKLGLSLLPDAFILMRGIPKLVMLIEFSGESQEEVDDKLLTMQHDLAKYKLQAIEDDNTEEKAWKFRIMRRESFNLLRKKVHDKHTAPFIDDLVVPPAFLPEFLPKLRKIIDKYKLLATVAGHMGDGNFHIIPLMKLEDPKERKKLLPAMKEVNALVLKYHGSLSGEHNDGMIRGPWLRQMYGNKVVDLFEETKDIFDPNHLFNPHKKANASWEFSYKHIRDHF